MDRRLPRRTPSKRLALTLGALVLTVPGVASCGFNYATDREYTPAVGANHQSGEVDVLNALIVSDEDGSGTFIASMSNNSSTETVHLTTLGFGSASTVEVAGFDPIEVRPEQLVNLADGQGIKVSGDFAAGDFLTLSLTFDNDETADLTVPVVATTYEYEDLDNGTGAPSPAPSPSATP